MKVSKYRIALESVLKCETAAAKSPLARVRTKVYSLFAFTTFTESRVIDCNLVFCNQFSDNF